MRKLLIGLAALALGSPAAASTLTEVTTHGIILTVGDMDIPVAYTTDGKFTAMDGQVTGTWRIDGDKLCTISTADPNESCIAYPMDKKSGDLFTLDTPVGAVQIKIR